MRLHLPKGCTFSFFKSTTRFSGSNIISFQCQNSRPKVSNFTCKSHFLNNQTSQNFSTSSTIPAPSGSPQPVSKANPKTKENVTISGIGVSRTGKVDKSKLAEELKDWKPIYRFNHILGARAVQRLKLYQTGITVGIILPWSIITTITGQTEILYAYLALAASALACGMLYVMGTFSSRIIGAIYMHKEDPDRINVARLTFFGSRVDTQLATESFIPLADMNQNPFDVYIKLQPVDGLEEELNLGPMYISLRFGKIFDLEDFERVFGDVSAFVPQSKKS